MKILFIGDVFGEPGRQAVKEKLPLLRQQHGIDFVVANVENAAHGKGVTPKMIEEFQQWGVNACTAGNHIWDQREIVSYIANSKILMRPANYPTKAPGEGSLIFEVYAGIRVVVISLEGQVLMGNAIGSPFEAVDRELEKWKGRAEIFVVDMHAEATSEKRAMGWYLDGRVAAVVGTHTHVPTADEEILPNGTAYITDVGMSGPYRSVIGLDKDVAIRKFTTRLPEKFVVGTGDARLSAVLIDVDERTGKAKKILRIQERVSL
ncbi:MAG: TIGR00282 family metallophosphoesterase [Deltaproteobacteria bacterium]|nr:TIGR00282 family metallophosphoesterase [Deltaproteobacteria bacterium]